MNFTDLDDCVRSFRGEMIAFTNELVSIASENPGSQVRPHHASPFPNREVASGQWAPGGAPLAAPSASAAGLC
jgi:hypothetical protein